MSFGHSPWHGESHNHDSANESCRDLLSGPNGISLRSGECYLGIDTRRAVTAGEVMEKSMLEHSMVMRMFSVLISVLFSEQIYLSD